MDMENIGMPANYKRGVEFVGGKIYFDDKGLIFKPHKLNFHTSEVRIDFCDIRGAEPSKTLGLIPNGLLIYTKDNKQHQFVSYSCKEIAAYIRSKISL